jgi:hypothetical protein
MDDIIAEWLERLTAIAEVATCPAFDPCIRRPKWNLRAADEAVLKKILEKNSKKSHGLKKEADLKQCCQKKTAFFAKKQKYFSLLNNRVSSSKNLIQFFLYIITLVYQPVNFQYFFVICNDELYINCTYCFASATI